MPSEAATMPPRPAQTFIVGTEPARKAFCTSYVGTFRITDSAITCDLSGLRSLRAQSTWRWVAIVSSAAELRGITSALDSVAPSGTRLLVAAVTTDLGQIVAVRQLALQLGAAGVVVKWAGCAEARAVAVVKAVVAVWVAAARKGGEPEEGDLKRAWGEPAFASEEDFVVPPGWDSEGKIRAICDAANIDCDDAAGDGGEVFTGVQPVRFESEEQQRERARESKQKAMEVHRNWIRQFSERIGEAAREESLAGGTGDTRPVARTYDAQEALKADSVPHSNFFQKLLAGEKR